MKEKRFQFPKVFWQVVFNNSKLVVTSVKCHRTTSVNKFRLMKNVVSLSIALSEKIEKQLQFLSDENTDARAFQAIKIFSGFKCKDGSYHCLNEDSLIPFVKFIAMNSIGLPLTSPALSLELMMIASYNLFHEMEKSMALILLAQPLDLYNVETSLYLYWFSSLKHEVYEDGPQKRLWELLRVRSLWNLKW